MMKRLTMLAAMVLLCVTAMAVCVSASFTKKFSDGLTWTMHDDGTLVIEGEGAMEDWEWPSKTPWHSYLDSIKAVTIGNGVTSIGKRAFDSCTSLTSVTIGNGVTSIGYHAFDSCTSLTSVTIGSGVTSIGKSAFLDCESLTGVVIPEGVTSIDGNAFIGCLKLQRIVVDKSNPNYATDSHGVLFNKEQTQLIAYPCGKPETTYTIPESVTSIGDSAFWDCKNLTDVVIPESVTSIDESAFNGCESLTDVIIPESVTSIGERAFSVYPGRCVIYGAAGSAGAAYAGEEDIPFLLIPGTPDARIAILSAVTVFLAINALIVLSIVAADRKN